jgi:hypothetical protein
LTKSQVAAYKQKGLNPSILDGKEIIRFPNIPNNSLTECSHVALSEMIIPSDLFMPTIPQTFYK